MTPEQEAEIERLDRKIRERDAETKRATEEANRKEK